MGRDLTKIAKKHYRVMHRTPAVFSSADYADLTAHTAFLATFTEMGYCRDKSIKVNIEPGEKEPVDTGKKKTIEYNGKAEWLLNQSSVADYTSYEAIEGIDQDILLLSENGLVGIFLPAAILTFKEAVTSGEIETIPCEYEAEGLAAKADFRTRYVVPVV